MTPLLEKALFSVNKLALENQEMIVTIILDELEDEKRWNNAFLNSQSKLSQLAKKVRADIQAGKIKKSGINDL